MRSLTFLVLWLSTVTPALPADYDILHPARLGLAPYLSGEHLQYEPLRVGMELPMNTLIIMPAAIGGFNGFVQIQFERSDLSERFVQDFFYGNNDTVRKNHPFAYQQVEPILEEDRFIMNLHDGLILHLRDDWSIPEGYSTFEHSGVIGKVTKVRGDPLCSLDHEIIRDKLRDFFVSWKIALHAGRPGVGDAKQRSDGRIEGTAQLIETDIPRYYLPRVKE